MSKEQNTEKKTETPTLKLKDLEKPLVGTYCGTREVEGKFGNSLIHAIGDQEIWGTTDLNKQIDMFSEGTTLKVEFNGKEDTGKGGFRYKSTVSEID